MKESKSNYLLLFLLFMALFTAPFTEDVQGCTIAIAPILGAAMLSAGTGFANGVVNNIVNRSNQRYQADIAKELMDYQWKNFTSPSAQVKAYGQAGINPAVALGQGGAGHVSGPSVNMPTGVPASFDFGGFAQGVQALALAKQAGVDIRKAEVEIEAKQYDLDLNKAFRSPERVANLILAWKNVRLSDDEHNIKVWTETKEKALAGLSQVQKDTAQKVLDNMDIQLQQENKQRQESIKLTQEEQKTEGTKQVANRASAAASSASARLSNAQAQTEDDLREYRKNALELGNKLQGLEYGFNKDTYQQRIEKFASELGIVKWTAFLNEIEAKDRKAYNAVQRLIMGKGVKEDGKTLWNLINDGRQLIPYK